MKNMLPSTQKRVAMHTSPKTNEKIKRQTEARLAAYSKAPAEAVRMRLEELDQEWDIERALETNGSVLLLLGLGLGTFVSRKWLLLPAAVGSFCLQHALQGWCPPLEVFRRLGVRTAREIEDERQKLSQLKHVK